MNSYIALLMYIGLAELLRRCCLSLIFAFTGPLSKIPGPFLNKITHLPWTFQIMTGNSMNISPEYFKKYGDVVRVAPRDIIFASKSGIQNILVNGDFIKAPIYDSLLPHGNITSLLTERDKTIYRQKRRHISPGFSITYLNGLELLMRDCVTVFEEFLDAECVKGGGSAVVNMSLNLGNLTSDVMSATSFGGSMNLVKSNDTRLKNIFMNRLKRAALDSQFPFFKHLPFVPPSQSPELNGMVDSIISRRRAEKGTDHKDLLQILVDVNEKDPVLFSEKHIHEEMILFVIAGSDTTSSTATFTLFLLMNNLEKYKVLVAEIDEAFPSKDDPITFAKTRDLPYLNAVLNECMRLRPIIAGGLARYVTESTFIDEYEIPPNTLVGAHISTLMKDPRIWPDSGDFIPERWLGNYKGVDVDLKAFYPFSAGSRNCIGQQFAMRELRLIIATLVRRYDLTLVPGQSHEMRVHTVPYFKQGFYNVGVKPRI